MKWFEILILGLAVGLTRQSPTTEDYDYDVSDEDDTHTPCDPTVCRPPKCKCFGTLPEGIPTSQLPQLVMLTFDDAMTAANVPTYEKIVRGRTNRGNDCPIALTFFVCHDYNDYNITNTLYEQGHEIAVHSISHESDTDIWKNGNEDKWRKELSGMRTVLNTFGLLPREAIVGHRAPFLQTSGDPTFRVLHKDSFLYDASMPTRNHMEPPIWPYTLDNGYAQDCQIAPCPKEAYPGLWVIPMVQYELKSRLETFYCSMADACTPQPVTAQETRDYLMSNFRRHYNSNKAPFPVFLHEGWLRDEHRLLGYLQFLDEILSMEDVFAVTVKDVVRYLQKPQTWFDYSKGACPRVRRPAPGSCNSPKVCNYEKPVRLMKSCVSCPKYFPWVGTPLGKRQPVIKDWD